MSLLFAASTLTVLSVMALSALSRLMDWRKS